MATNLVLPDGVRPSNLHLPEGMKAEMIESDVFDICSRIAEVSPDIYIVVLHDQDKHAFAIMESCSDGVERLAFKVGPGNEIDALDTRVVVKLRKLLALPLAARLLEFEKLEAQWKREAEEREFEELYDQLGRPMWSQLEHDGFIQRPVSYPKRGVAQAARLKGPA